MTAAEIVQAPKMWVSYVKFISKENTVELALSEDRDNQIEVRVNFISEIEKVDAEYLARKLQKRLEWV